MMAELASENLDAALPSNADARLARESSRKLSKQKLGRVTSVSLRIVRSRSKSESVTIPVMALRPVLKLLHEMAEGHAVAIVPTHSEITTQQAADLLQVSRPFLVKLLKEKKIPCRVVGKHRRVRLADIMAFKRKDDAARNKILDQLTAEAQLLGMGY